MAVQYLVPLLDDLTVKEVSIHALSSSSDVRFNDLQIDFSLLVAVGAVKRDLL